MQSPADRFYLSNSSDIVERNMEDVGTSVVAVTHSQFYSVWKSGDWNFCEKLSLGLLGAAQYCES